MLFSGGIINNSADTISLADNFAKGFLPNVLDSITIKIPRTNILTTIMILLFILNTPHYIKAHFTYSDETIALLFHKALNISSLPVYKPCGFEIGIERVHL